jgi:triacylglycerol lipase
MPSVLALLDLLPNGGGDGKAFECLTTQSMSIFNEQTPDVEDVRYFSWGAWYEPGLIDTWKYPHSVVMEKEGPNDGLVSVESSKWGQYLGTLEDVNHLDLVGWVNPARYKWAEITGREIKFRPATFYLGIADWLAGEVEGISKDCEGDHGKGKGKIADGVRVSDGTTNEETQMESGEVIFDADLAEDQNATKRISEKVFPNRSAIFRQPNATNKISSSDMSFGDGQFPPLWPTSTK